MVGRIIPPPAVPIGTYAASRTRKTPSNPLTFTAAANGLQACAVGVDGYVYSIAVDGSNRVSRSNDGFATITAGVKFTDLGDTGTVIYVNKLTEGYVAVLTAIDGLSGSLWFSSAFATGWSKVQDIGPNIGLSVGKPVITANGTVWTVGEYWVGTSNTNAKLWLTRDGGQTWTAVKTKVRSDGANNNHWHGSAYDAATGRLWASGGDNGNDYFGYSDDFGATWTDVTVTTGAGPDESGQIYNHPTLLAVCSNRILATPDGDRSNAGVWGIDKTTGQASVIHETVPVYAYKQFARGRYAQDLNVQDEVYFLWPPGATGNDESHQAVLAGTGDGGESFHNLWRAPVVEGTDFYVTGVVGPDSSGRLYVAAKNNNVWSLLVGTKPRWQPQSLPNWTTRTKQVTAAGPRVILPVTVSNTTSVTPLVALPISRILERGDVVRIWARGTILVNVVSAVNFTIRMLLGGTAPLATNSGSLAVSTSTRQWRFMGELFVEDPATSQYVGGDLIIAAASASTMGISTSNSQATGTATSAVDLTAANKTLGLDVQMGTADPNVNCVLHHAWLEVIKAGGA